MSCEIAQIAVALRLARWQKEKEEEEREERFSAPTLLNLSCPPVITHRHRSTRTAAKLHHPTPPISNPLSSYKTPHPTPPPIPTRQHRHHFASESGSLHWTTTRGLESDKTFRHAIASSDKTNTFTYCNTQVSLALTLVKVWCFSPMFGPTIVNNEASVFSNYLSIKSDIIYSLMLLQTYMMFILNTKWEKNF